MTDFEGHLKIGLAVGGLGSGATVLFGGSTLLAGGIFVASVVCSLIPDLDIHSSVPRQRFGQLLRIGLPVAAIAIGINRPQMTESLGMRGAEIIGIGEDGVVLLGMAGLAVGGLIGAYLTGGLLDELTTHRGIFHSPWFGIVVGGVTTAVLHYEVGVSLNQAWPIGAAACVGILAHVYIGDR